MVSGSGADFYVVALHEIGHAIGLGHVTGGSEVMNPTLGRDFRDLFPGDMAGAIALYGPADGMLAPGEEVSGMGGLNGPVADDGPVYRFYQTKTGAHFYTTSMVEKNWGRIVNIPGKSEPERLIAATPAKAAVHAWSKGLSREVGKHGITVNCIPPGRIMSEQIRRKYSDEFRAEQSAKEIPVGRYGEPEELAALAVFLCSPAARYITGTVMPVDGGLRKYAF